MATYSVRAFGREGERVGIAPRRRVRRERDRELLAHLARREIDPRHAVRSRERDEQLRAVKR